MSPRLTPLKSSQILRILAELGFEKVRQESSHVRLRHPDGRVTTVPVHKGEDISRGLIKKILQDIEITWEEFISYK